MVKKTDKKKTDFPRDYTDYWTAGGYDWLEALNDLKKGNWFRSREDNVKILMEHYCFLTKYGRDIPRQLQVWIGTAFWNFVENGKKLDTAFELKESRQGRKSAKGRREHPYFPNNEVLLVLESLGKHGGTLYKATELVHRKTKRPISTIRDMCSIEELKYATEFHIRHYEESFGERIPIEHIKNLKNSGYYFKDLNYAHYDDNTLKEFKKALDENIITREQENDAPQNADNDDFPF